MAVESVTRASWDKAEQIEVIESLLAHPGWALLAHQARQEWETRERAGRRTALNDTDDKRALDKLRQITAAQEAVEWVLSWPQQEMARQKRQEMGSTDGPPSGSASDLAQIMSRRGSL